MGQRKEGGDIRGERVKRWLLVPYKTFFSSGLFSQADCVTVLCRCNFFSLQTDSLWQRCIQPIYWHPWKNNSIH